MNILIVEDDSTLLMLAEMTISSHFPNANITLSKDGEEAWRALATNAKDYFHIIISDHQMPKLSGLELSKQVTRDLGYTPYFCLVSGDTRCFKDSGYPQGRFSQISKPYEENELVDFVKLSIPKKT